MTGIILFVNIVHTDGKTVWYLIPSKPLELF